MQSMLECIRNMTVAYTEKIWSSIRIENILEHKL